MPKERNTIARNNIFGTLAGMSFLIASPIVFAATANELDCIGCVGTTDLANVAVGTAKLKNGAVGTDKLKNGAITTLKLKNGAVSTDKLKNGAVATAKLKNGAVSYSKLAPDVKAVVDDAVFYDYRDYIGSVNNVTQKIYAVSGHNFGCGLVNANPDTEIVDITRTDLGGGVTEVVHTAQSYAGGVGGTLCFKIVRTYMADPNKFTLVRQQSFFYQQEGAPLSLFSDLQTEYYSDPDPDLGLALWTSKMQEGKVFGSVGPMTNAVDSTEGFYISNVAFSVEDGSETIDEDGPNHETFDNCVKTIEERSSTQGHLGKEAIVRIACAGVGTVFRGSISKSDGRHALYDLVEYTTAP